MHATESDILAWFENRGFPVNIVRHPPIMTVADGESLRSSMQGGHTKSLLVEDKQHALFLIVALGTNRAHLNALRAPLGATGRLSFASENTMVETLGVRPGSVTPMALINDHRHRIRSVVIDAHLSAFDQIWCHPVHNKASIGISHDALTAFVSAHGPPPSIIDITDPKN